MGMGEWNVLRHLFVMRYVLSRVSCSWEIGLGVI